MKKLYKCTLFCSDWMTAIVVIDRGRRGRDRMVEGFHIITNWGSICEILTTDEVQWRTNAS
jgi:hypothetical protein